MIKEIINLKYKKVYIDVLLNFFAVAVSLGVLEIIIYPALARKLTVEEYGEMQTIISIIYLFGATMGQTLSTTRLVKQVKYSQQGIKGDYNLLILLSIPIAIMITVLICVFYFDLGITSIIRVIFIVTLICAEGYYEVGFRLELNYKRVLYCRAISCVGYIVGFFCFLIWNRWEIIFIISYLFQLLYCLRKTDLLKEQYNKTVLFKETTTSYVALNIASVLSKSLTYFDKLMLYPMLGGAAVSVYFSANLMGKLVLKTLEPVNNVFLSYLSKKDKISKSLWKIALITGFLVCCVAYIICLIVSKPILMLFYPQWAESAMNLIPLTTATLCISALSGILYPFSLKILAIPYQCLINGICLTMYIILVLILVGKYGLIGSCVALLISYFIKMIIMICLCSKYIDTDEKQF